MILLKIDQLLHELNITGKELAEAAGLRPNTITELKNSRVKGIDFNTADKLLDAANDIAAEKGIQKNFDINDIIEYRRMPD